MLPLFLAMIFSFTARADDARLVARKITQMGFSCEGFHCRVRVADYSRPVDVFIAPQLRRARPLLLAYHLHGWWLDERTSPFDGPDGDFAAFLARSGVNGVLIVPQSRGKNTTYAEELATPQRMSRFLRAIENLLFQAGVPSTLQTPRALSGHSGAYVQMGLMGGWAASGEVEELSSLRGVALLDSAYGYRAGLLEVLQPMCRNGRATYMLAFNPDDGSTGKRDTNRRLWDELQRQPGCRAKNLIYSPDARAAHTEFPRKYLAAFLAEAAK